MNRKRRQSLINWFNDSFNRLPYKWELRFIKKNWKKIGLDECERLFTLWNNLADFASKG